MKKINLLVVLAMLSMLLLNLNPVQAADSPVIVTISPANMNGWTVYQEDSVLGTGDFVPGPKTALEGSGSARLMVDTTARTNWAAALLTGTPFSQITRLEYSTYVVKGGPSLAIAFQVGVDYTGVDTPAPGFQGRLVYEPYMSGTVVQGTWQTWDTKTGKWWTSRPQTFGSEGPLSGHTCVQGDPCTWGQLLQNWPNLRVHPNPLYGAVLLRAGGPWSGFEGMVDQLTIGVNDAETIYDFEPASTVYVNNTWGSVALGADPDGSGPAIAMGLDAFTTIQAGVDHVADDGRVEVAAGTYVEQVKITRPLTLNGAGIDQTVVQAPVYTNRVQVARANISTTYDFVIGAFDASGVTIQNLSVDGHKEGKPSAVVGDRAAGIVLVDADATVQNAYIHDVQMPDSAFGAQSGSWAGLEAANAMASGTRTVTIKDVTVEKFQKNGISIRPDTLNGMDIMIDGANIIATPEARSAQNGIQIMRASGVVKNSTISGVYYTGGYWSATSLMLYGVGAVTVENNRIEDGQLGIYLFSGQAIIRDNTLLGSLSNEGTAGIEADAGYDSNDTEPIITGNNISGWGTGIDFEVCSAECSDGIFNPLAVHFNRIVGNTDGLINNTTTAVDAINNWWGCNAGPNDEAGLCDTAAGTGTVDADPWLVLRLSADGTRVTPQTPLTLTASLVYNSDDVDTHSLGLLPQVGSLAFSATRGTLAPASMLPVNSAGQSILSVAPGVRFSTGSASVVYDNQMLELTDLGIGTFYSYLPVILKNGK